MRYAARLIAPILLLLVSLGILNADTTIPPGPITTDTTWDISGSPFILACDNLSGLGVSIPAGVTLTVLPGVTVKFQLTGGTCFSGITVFGNLIANGTSAQQIVFTSALEGSGSPPFPGSWNAIVFQSGAGGSISNAAVRYGDAGSRGGAIRILTGNSSPTVTGNSITDNLTGIGVSNADTTVTNATISNNTFSRNTGAGIRIDSGAPPVSNNVFQNNGDAIEANIASSGGFSGNTASANAINGVVILPRSSLPTGANISWGQTTIPYVLRTFGVGSETVFVSAGASLTINPGVVVKLEDVLGPGFLPGKTALNVSGTLIADGTAAPIYFTALSDGTVGGDTINKGLVPPPPGNVWGTIIFASGSSDSVLKNVTVRYGFSAVQINTGNSFPSITNSTFSNNLTAISVAAGSTPHITFNNIQGNSSYGVINADCPNNDGCMITPVVDATNNYWGSPTGPSGAGPGTGDRVSFHVNFGSFKTQPLDPPSSITSISPPSGTQGQTISDFTVNGTNFQSTSTLSFSATGITVNSYATRNATQLVASITIGIAAPVGPADVIVTNPDTQQVTLPGAFTVIQGVPTPLLVSASYYPWYTPERWQYQDCTFGTIRQELIPAEYPTLGEYQSRQQEVISQHLAWSAASGINVWQVEWVQPGDYLDQTLQNFILANPGIAQIKFAIFYDYAIRFHGDLNLTIDKINTIVDDMKFIADNYFTHPSYLKVAGGRPVIFFYLTRALNPLDMVGQMASMIRSALSAKGFNIYLVGDEYNVLQDPNPDRIRLWDGIFGYDVYMSIGGYSDDNNYLSLHSMRHDQYDNMATQLGVDFIPSIAPGFNDRAVRRTCQNHPALSRRTSADAPEGSLFRGFLSDIALPHAVNSRLRVISITSFNEWHEDTQIEPTVLSDPTSTDTSTTGNQYTQGFTYQGYGTLYLDIIRDALAAASTNMRRP